ncbi:hypothetical protein ACH5RR_011398 [Cinchona calisaya]|uniref:RPW8 domain-containing protein n=1 Tax=Cinchona calisaya TaxID=153742 RepID=A0ABD3A8D8_9GENT
MAVNLTEGAALGTVFDRLFQAVLDGNQQLTTFTSTLNSLKSTLALIKPILDDLEKLNKALDRPEQETEMFVGRLIEGENLVRKCSKIKSWDLYNKHSYSKKIKKLEDSITRFFQLDVQAQMVRNTKRILIEVKDTNQKLDKVLSILKDTA